MHRVPVIGGGRAVGIVSLEDLAVERDPDAACGEMSGAPPRAGSGFLAFPLMPTQNPRGQVGMEGKAT